MGRAFEFRKARKLKRWGNMAKVFTRLGKEIAMAVKSGGPEPANNPRLRVLIQNAKAANMPKDNVERAIKKASNKDQADYKEVIYEGYAPHGIAVLVETATDNTTRTVANIRMYFSKYSGSFGNSGSVAFMFEHKCHFKVKSKEGIDLEELELEMIDYGVQEIFAEEDAIIIYGEFESFGPIQKYLEEHSFELISAEFEWIPNDTKELNPEQVAEVEKLLEKMEEDEDVNNVFHNMK
ncbi:MAG: transcriptional regulator [Bacteroidetes bacterium RIFOXYA12_FULL_35_11]|nr:MAG: transcriptional regulator [Bacteroidetes bacterium GWF2_35_48]OFY79998.1 MAG: transcriptional regulator [Bacteroidetes bacterium RIFOXYA12_FULL_35_11]OFY92837.1 MAG: transcriptional regulator [Bacteroidetes bacterium RIFOXYC12_FULL_35_7]HBX51307.1 YebC/PmpR family DNA-binding transcriptional regulator [Bacteroidales bacterium]